MWDAACGLFAPVDEKGDESEWMSYVGQRSSRNLNQPSPDDPNDANQRMSPFLKYNDGYVYPDLFSEVDEMLESCVLIYALVELRRKARQQAFDAPTNQLILELPMSHPDLFQIVLDNRDALLDTKFGKDFYLQTLKVLQERTVYSPTKIIACDDAYEQRELVYTVEVNDVRKRVTVVFRGSVTELDWATNYEIYMKQVHNPNATHATQDPHIKLHNGFHDYLLLPNRHGTKGKDGHVLNEYEEILHHHVLPVLNKNPDYKLYVTGHSLGAALATLFGFYAASEPDTVVHKPVSVFSIAAPYVGDASFRSSHQLLEGLGKLRHLRVSNHGDIVTIVPKMSWSWNVFSGHVGTLFKHVGMNLRLYGGNDTSMEIAYPRVRTGYILGTLEELSRGWEQSMLANLSWNPYHWHHLMEYTNRLDNNQPVLQTLRLNDLYARKDIVGTLLAEF